MENVRLILAKNIRMARQDLGLSQEDLAAETNIDRTYISGIEREKRNPTILVVAKIAAVLKVTTAELFVEDFGKRPAKYSKRTNKE